MSPLYKCLFSVFLLTLSSSTLFGQYNLRVGYNVSYMNADAINSVMKSYNSNEPSLQTGYPELRVVHGIGLGIRYIWEGIGMELTYDNFGRTRSSKMTDLNGDVIDNDLKFSIHSLGFGLENVFEKLGYGANFNWNILRSKSEMAGTDVEKSVLSENFFGTKFYFMWNLNGSGNVSVSIRPYVQISLKDVSIQSFKEAIVPNATNLSLNESPTLIGISFNFYNGPSIN